MSLVSMNLMLLEAKKDKRAIGQFNINGLDFIQAFLEAAEAEKTPIILATTDRLVEYLGGFKVVASLVCHLVEEMKISVPICLHLDHAGSFKRCKEAIDAGYTSVMIDGSHLPIEENINMTKKVVDYAALKSVSVEAEVGTVGGEEDGRIGGINYADRDECLRLVKETRIDALAAALGSVHGPYMGEPKLAFAQMEEIAKLIDIPLVLHGASGIPDHQIKKAIKLGHAKINVNTENIQAWTTALRAALKNETLYEPRKILTPAKYAVTEVVRNKIKLFNGC